MPTFIGELYEALEKRAPEFEAKARPCEVNRLLEAAESMNGRPEREARVQ